MMNRRTLLVSATASAALAALGITPSALAASRIKLGEASPFGFDALIERARALAAKPYIAPPSPPADVLDRIDYEAHGKIHFRPDDALFAFAVRFDFAAVTEMLGEFLTDENRQKFMKDMEGKSSYSEKQMAIIERIYAERTA